MSFFTLRINKIKVKDNREIGKGELKLLSFVTTEDQPLPLLDDYFSINDPQQKKEILKLAAEAVVSSKVLMQLDYVSDNHEINFGDTGYALWTSGQVINSFNWQMVLVEVDDDVREVGAKIEGYLGDSDFDKFLDNVMTLVGVATNPTVTLSIAVAKYIIGKVAKELISNKDDQVGLVYQSFARGLDYPALDRQASGVPDMSGNLSIDYRIYGEE